MAIDYGRKRCGIAVTDVLQIVATALATVPTGALDSWVKEYIAREDVERIIVGEPRQMNGEPSESTRYIRPGIERLRRAIGDSVPIEFFDERFTSTLAHRSMIDAGVKKKDRRDKESVDRIAATIILNSYLESRNFRTNR